MKTSFGFDLHMQHAYFVKGTKERTNRAEISAPSTFNTEDKDDKKNENNQRNWEEIIWHKLPRVQYQNREGSYQHPNRTDIGENKPNKK
jgi:hypothetical protein